MTGVDLADFEFLLTEAGQALLAAAAASYDGQDSWSVSDRLRRLDDRYEPGRVAAALTQVELRQRAESKFGERADRLYFTPTGLEQATAGRVAAWRAQRILAQGVGQLDGDHVLDLGCGVGADLIATADAGLRVIGVERDPLTAAVAAANLAALGLPGSVRVGTAEETDLASADGAFCDPSRRKGSGRIFEPHDYSPGWPFVLDLLTMAAGLGSRPRLAVVKLAPGIDHDRIPGGVEAEWVSLDGDLKEAALWASADSVNPARATVLRSDGRPNTRVGRPDEGADGPTAEPGDYVYEPDPAIVRAHLVSTVVAEVDGWLLDPHLAYVSANQAVATPFARCFRVLEALPFQEKALRAALRARDVGTLTIKKRGIAVRPEDLRRRLGLRGSRPATVILTRTPGSAVALLVEPLP